MDHHHHVPMASNHHNPSSSATANIPKKKPKPPKLRLPSSSSSFSFSPLQDHNNIARPCTECGKKFSSWKALFGHMRCHPERQWRGINPPPNLLRPTRPNHHRDDDEEEEEEEVASCLLMLANGPPPPDLDSQSPTTTVTTTVHHAPQLGLGLGLGTPHYCSHISHVDPAGRFECSVCKKVFGSHQALGGHRASHKNVKGCFANTKKSSSEFEDDGGGANQHCNYADHNTTGINLHKCSICWRVFSSGQALGGHMRCHWEKKVEYEHEQDHCINTEPSSSNSRVVPNYRAFDLNLPAPIQDDLEQDEDDDDHSIRDFGDNLDLRLGV